MTTIRGSGLEVALAVWRRRKWLTLPVFLIPFAVTVGVVRTLPAIYESTATVLVGHHQDLQRPSDAATISELETRLRTIREQILSRDRLGELITRFDLYPDRRAETPDELVRRLRRDIRLDFNELRDQFAWRTTTIAVVISYRSRDPELVAPVANALAEMFVAENTRIRREYAGGAAEFLRAQLEEARRQLDSLERAPGRRALDYDVAANRYRFFLERYEEARLAQRIGQQMSGELSVVDAAVPPHDPVAPRRLVILLMGFILSVGAAAGAALLAEARDTAFRTIDDLRAFTSVPVLVAIPPIVTRADAWRRVARVAVGAVVVGLAAVVAGVASSHLAQGNELLVRILTPDRF